MATLVEGMKQTNQTSRALDRALSTWRTEAEMPAKDKYWVFSKKDRESGYRKGAHKVPKWTKYVIVSYFKLLTCKDIIERSTLWILELVRTTSKSSLLDLDLCIAE
jgi:hypothetical protein